MPSAFTRAARLALVALPLEDEPHLEAWTAYAQDAARIGAFSILAPRLPQFRFPVEHGISDTAAYRAERGPPRERVSAAPKTAAGWP